MNTEGSVDYNHHSDFNDWDTLYAAYIPPSPDTNTIPNVEIVPQEDDKRWLTRLLEYRKIHANVTKDE